MGENNMGIYPGISDKDYNSLSPLEKNALFYREPSGCGSQGGYDYLSGKPREIPEWMQKDEEYFKNVYFWHYDYVSNMSPEDQEYMRSKLLPE